MVSLLQRFVIEGFHHILKLYRTVGKFHEVEISHFLQNHYKEKYQNTNTKYQQTNCKIETTKCSFEREIAKFSSVKILHYTVERYRCCSHSVTKQHFTHPAISISHYDVLSVDTF